MVLIPVQPMRNDHLPCPMRNDKGTFRIEFVLGIFMNLACCLKFVVHVNLLGNRRTVWVMDVIHWRSMQADARFHVAISLHSVESEVLFTDHSKNSDSFVSGSFRESFPHLEVILPEGSDEHADVYCKHGDSWLGSRCWTPSSVLRFKDNCLAETCSRCMLIWF